MEIITGRTGTPHVRAIDDATLYKQFLGNGDWVLPVGQQFESTMQGSNAMTVGSGYLVMQGRLAAIRAGDGADTVTFDNGVSGQRRVDLVVAEYSIDDEGIETIDLVVIKGKNNPSQYIMPTAESGDIDAGDTHQMPMFAVYFDGLNFLRKEVLFTPLTTSPLQPLLDEANAYYDQMVQRMETLQTDIYKYADDLMEAIESRVKGHWYKEKAENVTNLQIDFTPADDYEYSVGDVVCAYINGLRVNCVYQGSPVYGEATYDVSGGVLSVYFPRRNPSADDKCAAEVWR